jgi:hypothetical protein
MNRKIEISQARFEEIDGTAGVDGPDHAPLLHLLDLFHAAAIENGVEAMRDQRPIEVSAE